MLDNKLLRQQPDQVAAALARRGLHIDLGQFQQLDQARRSAETRSQELLAERNRTSRQVGTLIREGLPVEEAKARVQLSLERIEGDQEELLMVARLIVIELWAWPMYRP